MRGPYPPQHSLLTYKSHLGEGCWLETEIMSLSWSLESISCSQNLMKNVKVGKEFQCQVDTHKAAQFGVGP
jgi:hypothetical protein